jgi:integrase
MNQLEEYFYTVKSEESRKTYEEYFRYFESFSKVKVTELLKLTQKEIQDLLIKYVIYMRDRKLSSSSIKGRLAPIFSILELNDLILNKKRVMKYVGESKKTVKDLAYTTEDIEKMVNVSKPRTRLIILIYASTGIRRSALLELKLKHLRKIEELGIYQFTIYENSKEEHVTYCTPECTTAIDQYIQYRKDAGENISKESWLIRNDFDPDNEHSVKNPKQTSGININTIIRNVLIKAGLRSVHQPQTLRNEKSTIHAFRKFTTTQFVNSNLNPEIREMLLSHSIGLTGVYYRPSEQTILNEYLKAIDNLTIDPNFRLKRHIKVLEGREKEIELIKSEHEKHEIEIQAMREETARLNKIISSMVKNPKLVKIKPDVLRKKVK